MTTITAETWPVIMEEIAQVMTQNAEHLCEMDAQMGDGDLGLTMKKGYCALPELYRAIEEADMGKHLTKSGMKMSGVVPSTMGTLMSSGWMEAGKKLVGKPQVGPQEYADFLSGFAAGIVKRGKCSVGDRTVLDAIDPAAKAAQQAAEQGQTLEEAAKAAFDAAQEGVEATKNMLPKYGKAAVFSGKALGVVDQGATAGMLLIQGLYQGIQKL